MGQQLRSMVRIGVLVLAGALGAIPIPAARAEDMATSVWLHDDAYVSAGNANVYIDIQCDPPGADWELTVRLTAVRDGAPTATGSAKVTKIRCTGKPEQVPVLVKPDNHPFFRTSSALNTGVAELRKAGEPEPVATISRRMIFYLWN
ncbi:hypothetical protein [Pendulispora albinea]|uniref:Uncharacterized protein n=1 Tax=Pendulispora albinea TaxID=2741071 RepID=A0ABZ2M1L5_9BACT